MTSQSESEIAALDAYLGREGWARWNHRGIFQTVSPDEFRACVYCTCTFCKGPRPIPGENCRHSALIMYHRMAGKRSIASQFSLVFFVLEVVFCQATMDLLVSPITATTQTPVPVLWVQYAPRLGSGGGFHACLYMLTTVFKHQPCQGLHWICTEKRLRGNCSYL